MKKFTLVLPLFFFAAVAFGQSEPSKETSMKPIMDDIKPLIEQIEGRGEEIVRMEYDIVNDPKETYRNLSSAYTYGIMAVGDYRIKKMGVELYEENSSGDWSLVKVDNADKYYASVLIKPSETKRYKIVVKAIQFEEGNSVGHYGLLVYHE